MKNKSLIYYIFGLLSGILFIPLLEEFINVVFAWIQVLMIKPSKIALKGNKEISELQSELEPVETNCIGFQMPSTEEYYEDEDDY